MKSKVIPPKRAEYPRRSFTVSKEDANNVRLLLSSNLITYNYKINVDFNGIVTTTYNALISDELYSIIKLSFDIKETYQLELDI